MLTDSVNGKKAAPDGGSTAGGKAKESITVVDVAQLLLDSVKTPVQDDGSAEPAPR